LNARESKLIGLYEAMESAVTRIANKNIVPGGVTTGGAAAVAVRALSANHPKLNDRMARPAWWQGR